MIVRDIHLLRAHLLQVGAIDFIPVVNIGPLLVCLVVPVPAVQTQRLRFVTVLADRTHERDVGRERTAMTVW